MSYAQYRGPAATAAQGRASLAALRAEHKREWDPVEREWQAMEESQRSAIEAEEAAFRELLAVLRQRQAVLERKQALANAVKLALESV